MKKKNNILSAVAVLAMSAVTAGALFAGCKPADNGNGDDGSGYNGYGSIYYVSADAKADGTGAKNKPMEISKLLGGNILKAGDTVLVQPGVYKLSEKIQMHRSGTYKHNITIKNAGTDGEKAVLDFSEMEFASTNRGVEMYSDYIYWYGIDICGAGDNGMYVGGSYNTIEYCEFYNNRDTGLQIGRQDSGHKLIHQWPSYNLIKNCTSHNNYDNETYGENADGFAAKLTVGYGNVFDGCVAYRNSDDGWDLYAKSDSGNIGQVIMYNCVAFENGYLEYTQAECNALFPNFRTAFTEANPNSYKTRDGDGNGFKLGGSVMVGDVLLENCLSFANRMHGVTDNSNPGYLYIDGVTGYNNSAAVDDNAESKTFGQIIDAKNHDNHNNIDVARQTYSYNTVKNSLSVKDGYAKSLGEDEYRGSVTDSILLGANIANKVSGTIDADTVNEGQTSYTEQIESIVSEEVFEKLPYVREKDTQNYTFNISGLKDLGADYKGGPAVNTDRVHHKYRNADGSVNMGDILAIKDHSKLLGDKHIGSELNKTKWEDYAHFTEGTMPEEVKNSVSATLAKAKESLYLDTDAENCYQNFKIPTLFNLCNVSWTSSDDSILKVGADYDSSLSGSEYVWVDVNRPAQDTKVKLTATISLFGVSVQKEFEVNVKKDSPEVGSVYVVAGSTGEVIENGGTVIFDGYQQYAEPALKVTNGAYKKNDFNIDVSKFLREDQYNLTTKYEYATEDGKPYKAVGAYTPNVAGVYRITHTVTLKDNEASKNTMTYKIFVASTDADLDWAKYDSTNVPEGGTVGANISSVTVNRYGYTISGRPNSAVGYLYAYASTENKEPSAQDFYEADGVTLKENVSVNAFRATSIEYGFENDNNSAYYIYYALANGKKEIRHVYKEAVAVVNIDSTASFKTIANGEKIGSEEPSRTIYMLTKCLDFSDVTDWTAKGSFSGVLNGAGHTVSNLSITGKKVNETALFNKVEGGTIMNIKFDNINLDASNGGAGNPFKQVGIVSRCYGGYFYNIQITDINVSGGQAVGALIGQLYENAPSYIEKVSVTNSDDTKSLYGPGNSVGGIIGLIQANADPVKDELRVYISDCYTNLKIGDTRYCGGIVGRYDTQKVTVKYYLEIDRCVSAGSMYATYNSAGGIIGAQQGNGTVKVSNSLFIGKLYHTYDVNNPRPLVTSQKNASGIFGAFVAAADVTITNCISILPEYNTAYQDGVEVETYFERKEILAPLFGTEDWTYHFRENDDNRLTAPYLSLIFKGDWNCNCGETEE